jgi:uncharacterized protein YlxP (DUF503 family)
MSSNFIQKLAKLWVSGTLTIETLLTGVILALVTKIIWSDITNEFIDTEVRLVYVMIIGISIAGYALVSLVKQRPHLDIENLKSSLRDMIGVQDLLAKELKTYKLYAAEIEKRNSHVRSEIAVVRKAMDALKREYEPVLEDSCPDCQNLKVKTNVIRTDVVDKRKRRSNTQSD